VAEHLLEYSDCFPRLSEIVCLSKSYFKVKFTPVIVIFSLFVASSELIEVHNAFGTSSNAPDLHLAGSLNLGLVLNEFLYQLLNSDFLSLK